MTPLLFARAATRAQAAAARQRPAAAPRRAASTESAVDTDAQLDAAVTAAGAKPLVVQFHATWCPPCRQLAPVLAKAAASAQVPLVTVDIDKAPELAARYEVSSVPTVYGLKGGKPAAHFVGRPREGVDEWLRALKS